jgi:hypothetical protein
MTFLAPYMLWGAAAASIPIALHFFFRSRYRTVPWAAMKFLLTSIEQTSRRLRFQELLLLIVRCALLVLLALALARPLSTVGGGQGRGDAVDAVFVFDTSFSMGASDGAVTRLERAKATALSIIDHLPPHSTVQVIACADRAALLGPRAPANLDQAREIIQDLRLTHLTTDLYPGVMEAAGVLERGQATNKELYVLSDMQKTGWEQQGGALVRTLQEVRDKATVYLVRCGQTTPRNVAVVGITPQSGVPRPGERVGFAVLIRNTGAEPVRDLEVALVVDGDPKNRETQAIGTIGPGETRAVTLTAKLDKAGLRVLTATIKHDDLDADNRFDQVVLVRDQVNVLVVDGALNEREPEKSASFYLMHALLPVKDADRAKYHLQPRLVSPRLASPALLAKQDLCILVNVPLQADVKRRGETLPVDFLDELEQFVRKGHGLLIFAGDHVVPDAYNRVLGDKHGLLPAKIGGLLDLPAKKPIKLNRDSADLPAFWKFKEDDYYKALGDIEVWRALDLEEPVKKQRAEMKDGGAPPTTESKDEANPVAVVLRYSNGKPAALTRKVDAGEVFMVTTSADPGWQVDSPDPTWTTLPAHPLFIPFVDVVVSHLLHGQTQNHNLTAGETLRWYPTAKEVQVFTLLHPDGRNERLGFPELMQGRSVVSVNNLPVAGIYRMTSSSAQQPLATKQAGSGTEETATPLAVVPDLRESEDLESLSDEQLDERLGFQPIHLTAGQQGGSIGVERINREWTLWILALVLGLALFESVLAWWCGRAW